MCQPGQVSLCEQVGFEVKHSQHIRGKTGVPQHRRIEGSEKDLIGDAVCDWDPVKLLETWGDDPGCGPDRSLPEIGPEFFLKKRKKKEDHKEIQKN